MDLSKSSTTLSPTTSPVPLPSPLPSSSHVPSPSPVYSSLPSQSSETPLDLSMSQESRQIPPREAAAVKQLSTSFTIYMSKIMIFVERAIGKLLETGAAIECKDHIPFVINPLTVSVNASALPFGLSTAAHVFSKVLRPVVKHWRSQGLRVILYLDDGWGVESNAQSCKVLSNILQLDLKSAGFFVNQEKSVWKPTQKLICIARTNSDLCTVTTLEKYLKLSKYLI
ncbi:unnamed protein product [Mytilus edulis]|uniref:Reverse transcriptase domain-containing protein n=1 Tax=Mytilus edulis TaxID=6550 RepID=A0A8S3TTG3_MYTED|nr:unnamed protein product [Mytilus edulis]